MKKFSIISIIGRSGSGKGTQIKLLQEKTGFEVIHTGKLLRRRAQRKDAVGRIVWRVLASGGLMPTPIAFSLWMPFLEQVKNKGKVKGIIFDGNPRKLYEAEMLHEVFAMFGWEKRFRACYIHISEKEAMRRLLARGRYDDEKSDIQERLAFFNREVKPALAYYKKRGLLVEINGERPVSEIHQEIMQKLKGFLK